MASIEAEYSINVIGADGSIISGMEAESDSFVENFTRLIEAGMWNESVSVVDTSGVARPCGNFTCDGIVGASGVTTRHILVGSGVTPVSPGDFALAEQIPNSGLTYQPSLVAPGMPYIEGGYIKSRIAKRAFVNETDAAVEISEIGIAVQASGYSVLILRDVLSSVISIPAGGVADISYTFKSPCGGGFTLNYMAALVCSFDDSPLAPVVDTDGVSRNIDFGGTFPANALVAQSHYGIVVGTSGDAQVGDEHSLIAPIVHGMSTGNLCYGAMGRSSTSVVGNTIEFSLGRSFLNLTPDPITIREVGLVARHSGYNILLERNVVDPIEILPSDGVNIKITHQTTI